MVLVKRSSVRSLFNGAKSIAKNYLASGGKREQLQIQRKLKGWEGYDRGLFQDTISFIPDG
jgi:hypothetical protein